MLFAFLLGAGTGALVVSALDRRNASRRNPLGEDADDAQLPPNVLALWGSSNAWSYAITGASAAMLGIPGYDQNRDARRPRAIQVARYMLRQIERAAPMKHVLYSGHVLSPDRVDELVAGARIRLPLTATTNDASVARTFTVGARGEPVLFRFAKGTKAYPYSHYLEWIVAGDFVIQRVRNERDPYWKTELFVVTLAPAPLRICACV